MEKRDLILRMIQQTAQLLRAVLHSLPLDTSEKQQLFLTSTSALKEVLNLEIENLILYDDLAFLTHVQTIEGMNIENLELVADLLAKLANHNNTSDINKASKYRQKALVVYQHINTSSGTYDFNRQAKINALH